MTWKNRLITDFRDNPLAITAHLIGKEYGMTPTDVMNRPAWMFWMDAQVRAAGVQHEQEMRDQAQQSGSAGAASDREKQDLVDDQEARADRRESQDGQPSLGDQLDSLDAADGSGGLNDG